MAAFAYVDFVANNERFNHIVSYAQSPFIFGASLHRQILPLGMYQELHILKIK